MKDERKKKRLAAKREITPDQRSDRLTAADIVVRLEQLQEDLGDLLYEFRYLRRFSELEDVAYVTWRLDVLREKCDHFAVHGSWKGRGE